MSDTFFMQEKKINMIDNKKEKLIVDNINLVYFMINKLRLKYKFDDYVDIGMIGLVKGVSAYDDSKNIKISTYLAKCIQNELLCHSRRMSVAKRKNKLRDISLSTTVKGTDIDGIELQDVIESDIDVFKEVCKRELFSLILSDIQKLNDRNKYIICSYFGLLGYKKKNQNEIADVVCSAQTTICRIINKFLNKMKEKYGDWID